MTLHEKEMMKTYEHEISKETVKKKKKKAKRVFRRFIAFWKNIYSGYTYNDSTSI